MAALTGERSQLCEVVTLAQTQIVTELSQHNAASR